MMEFQTKHTQGSQLFPMAQEMTFRPRGPSPQAILLSGLGIQ